MISLTKLKSVSEAAGKPTSISLKPISTNVLNIRCFLGPSMGSTSAWLPSRKSTLHQIGALLIVLPGHRRFVMGIVG